jgi:hypothetical protein
MGGERWWPVWIGQHEDIGVCVTRDDRHCPRSREEKENKAIGMPAD